MVLNDKILDEFKEYKRATFELDFYNHLSEEYEKLYGKKVSRNEMKEVMYIVLWTD